MNTNCIGKRALVVLGLMMIGEGVVGLIHPRRYSLFWKMGPAWMRNAAGFFADHQETTRLSCAGEIAVGLWLALREIKEADARG